MNNLVFSRNYWQYAQTLTNKQLNECCLKNENSDAACLNILESCNLPDSKEDIDIFRTAVQFELTRKYLNEDKKYENFLGFILIDQTLSEWISQNEFSEAQQEALYKWLSEFTRRANNCSAFWHH